MLEDVVANEPPAGSAQRLTCGELAVRSLALHGVDTVFGIPGTHNLELYAHLPAAGIRHVLPRHEQGAGYAAIGWARTTRRPGVVFVTTGPGVMNLATAAAQAWSDSVPLLILAPGMPRAHPAGAGGYLHEMPCQLEAMEGAVSRAVRVGSGGELAQELAMAFASFEAGRPRPVYIEVPLDLLESPADAEPLAAPAVKAPPPDPELLARAASAIGDAQTVAIIVGGGAVGAADHLALLAERAAAPVLATANGKGALPEDHPLSLGACLNLGPARELIASADVVIAIGTEFGESDLWDGPLEIGGEVIRVDIDPQQAHRGAVAEHIIIADASSAVRELAAALEGRARAADHASLAAVRRALTAEIERQGARWFEPLAAIRATLARDAIVTADLAMVCYYAALPALPVYVPNGFIFPTGFGTLGFALPAAIGAKLGAPEREVVALCGDGGLMFTVSELAGAAALGLSLPVVVFSNRGYGEIRRGMQARGDQPIAVDLPSPDLPLLARALGGSGVRAADSESLARELAAALERPAPTLIEFPEPS